MCGIAGIIDFAGRPVDEGLLGRMCDAIRHRGPDDRGIVRFPPSPDPCESRAAAALASQRLSIIDLQAGHQPIANEDGSVWTVLNGEIYNFRELRDELEQKGHRFATRSDTEVIVHLYEEQGEDFVRALDGMFALALWDDQRQCLLLARDRFGKKPLLYAESDTGLTFASEFQALLLDPHVSREMDLEALDYYLTYLSIPAPLSIYRGIRKIPPAHLLVRDRRGTTLRRYWFLTYTPKLDLGETEAGERVLELLTASVRKRLISEVPLGAFLSGGVDSSAVVALMTRLSGQPVKTFSIGFEEERYNELSHARRVAHAFGCDHHEFVVRPQALDVLPTLVRHFGEPFADSSAIPTYHLSRLTRQHVTVALNGDGGDEAFAGYQRHLANRFAEGWQRSPAVIRTPVEWAVRGVRGWCAGPGSGEHGSGRLRRFLRAAALSRAARYERWVGVFSGDLKSALLEADGISSVDGTIESLFHENHNLDAVDASLAVDTAFYLPTDLLVKMDITSMANSLEARSPFLDHHLVEFAARLPSSMKLRHLTSKYILKRALDGIVPRENLYRDKRGFAVPIGRWFRHDLRDFLVDHLSSSRFASRGLFRQDKVIDLISAHQSGRADYAHHLWILLVLELWFRTFIDG
jgi:asparagine synthase (glutamine-hydrolysing)